MANLPGDTPLEELTPTSEQTRIPALDNEDQRLEPTPEAPEAPPAAEPEKVEPAVDPRAARLEQLAERSRASNADELERAQEVTVPIAPKEEPTPAAPPERMIKLKVRGESVELPESEVIARAQKNDAADTYLTEARQLLEDAKKTARQPEPARTEPAPQPVKEDRIAKAVEAIQTGADPAEVKLLLDQEIDDRVNASIEKSRQTETVQSQVHAFDAEVDQGYDAVRKEYPGLANDVISTNVVVSLAGGMEGELVARFLETDANDATKSAFAQAGITAESVRRYPPQDAHALFKDMHLKGYQLPPPSAVIRAAGKTVAEWKPGATQPAAPQPETKPVVLDRTARKDAIQQPERASIPRATPGKPAPTSEPQRAAQTREEMRAERRTGSARR